MTAPLTVWGEHLDYDLPLNDYPRPQLRRDAWQNLNGPWEYAFATGVSLDLDDAPAVFDGTITVPFSPESVLSGVERQLQPGETLWYSRVVHVSEPAQDLGSGARLLLHFGAVDQRCRVYVNGRLAGSHAGGYWPFTLDITDDIGSDSEARLVVAVADSSDSGSEAWGKQRLNRGGIWYTAQSGIWQTVWCEWVPAAYISDVRLTPQWRESAVDIEVTGPDAGAQVTVFDSGTQVAQGVTVGGKVRLVLDDPRSWSPDDPFLYDVVITAGQDSVSSYFGLREVGRMVDADGAARLTLNGKKIFHSGLLDQGYWSDGLYTAPSDEAMVWDLETIKSMGFNMVRKHIKIEPLRWYYHCDRLGIMVWQDCVSGGGSYKPLVIQALPFVGVALKDSHSRLFGTRDVQWRSNYARDLRRTVRLLANSPSIAVWVPFNEGWGQFMALAAAREIRTLDPTRLVDHASGWHDQGGGDFASRHVYYKRFHPGRSFKGRALALTEFGGFSLPTEGHMSSEKLFGYKVFASQAELEAAIARLYELDVVRWKQRGLVAAIYTQVSDVEDEINGLVTFDRRVVKVDPQVMRDINARLLGD